MFGLSVAICAMVVAVGLIAPERLSSGAQAMTGFALRSLDWFFLLSCSGFLVLGLGLAFSRLGHIKLGRPDEDPEFASRDAVRSRSTRLRR